MPLDKNAKNQRVRIYFAVLSDPARDVSLQFRCVVSVLRQISHDADSMFRTNEKDPHKLGRRSILYPGQIPANLNRAFMQRIAHLPGCDPQQAFAWTEPLRSIAQINRRCSTSGFPGLRCRERSVVRRRIQIGGSLSGRAARPDSRCPRHIRITMPVRRYDDGTSAIGTSPTGAGRTASSRSM
nr:hypothetical protein [Paraburkholderia sp. BL8N3]